MASVRNEYKNAIKNIYSVERVVFCSKAKNLRTSQCQKMVLAQGEVYHRCAGA